MKRRRWPYWAGTLSVVALALLASAYYVSDKIQLRPDHKLVTSTDFRRKHAPPQLQADFKAMLTLMEHVHPDFDAIVDRPHFNDRAKAIMSQLDQPMSRTEFWLAVSPINGEFRDGHTSLERPAEEWALARLSTRVLPLQVDFDGRGILVRQSFDKRVPAGARITSVNGVPAGTIRDSMTNRTSGEGLQYRRTYAAGGFSENGWLIGLRAPFTIQWELAGTKQMTNIGGILPGDLQRLAGKSSDQPFSIAFEGSTAIMRIASLDQPEGKLREFLEQSFGQIRARRATSLILDIRDNGGGASEQGDLVQTYLSDDLLPGLRDVTVKTTAEVKARYRTLMPPGFRWIPINFLVPSLRGIQTSPDNDFFTFHPEEALPQRRKHPQADAFKGDLYLLIGPETYSSAAIFAAPLAYWRRATVIGQPTGEPLTFFGDNYEFDLPSTHLQATVSHKQFRLFGRGAPHQGIEPDVHIADGDDALRVAKDLIARKYRALK